MRAEGDEEDGSSDISAALSVSLVSFPSPEAAALVVEEKEPSSTKLEKTCSIEMRGVVTLLVVLTLLLLSRPDISNPLGISDGA